MLIWIVRMIVRELVSLRLRTVFFVTAVALGVGAYTGLVCLSDAVLAALRVETRTLLGGDIEVSLNRSFPPQVLRTLMEWPGAKTSHVFSTVSMARVAQEDVPRLSEVQAVDENYPLVGALRTEPAAANPRNGALVEASLMAGRPITGVESLVLGQGQVPIAGVLQNDPNQEFTSPFRGPRVVVSISTAERQGLLAHTSRFRDRVLLVLPEADLVQTKAAMEAMLKKNDLATARVRTHEQSAESLERRMENVRTFVLSVGLAVLLLSSLAAAAGIGEYLRQRMVDMARLRSLGATPSQTALILAGTIAAIVMLGCLVGGATVAGTWTLLQQGLELGAVAELPPTFLRRIGEVAVAVATTVGSLCLPQLAAARAQSPAMLLREGSPLVARTSQLIALLLWIPGLVAIPALFLLQAGQMHFALAVLGATVGLLLTFHVISMGLMGWLRRLLQSAPLYVRLAIDELLARRRETTLTLAVIGFSVFLTLLVNGLRNDILAPLQEARTGGRPDVFFIDVQPDQLAPFEAFLASAKAAPVIPAPLVRARLTRIGERAVRSEEGRFAQREQNLTYRTVLGQGEEVVEGTFWDAGPAKEWMDFARNPGGTAPASAPVEEVSLERSFAERINAHLGTVLQFDVQGLPLRAKVTSIREVVWQTWRPNFFIVLHPSLLAEAPQVHIVAAGVPDASVRDRLVRDAQDRFGNVSAIDISGIVSTLLRIGSTIERVINLLVLLLLLCSAFLLASSLLATRFLRDRHFAILRAVGMEERDLWKSLAVEFGILGALGASLGAAASLVVLSGLAKGLLDLPGTPRLWPALGGMALLAILCVVLGLALTHGSLRRKPLEVLRG